MSNPITGSGGQGWQPPEQGWQPEPPAPETPGLPPPGQYGAFPPPGAQPPPGPPLPYPPPPPGYAPPVPYGQPQFVVAPKSPGLGLLASFFIPGLGSMIAGKGGKGALILVLYIVSCVSIFFFIGFIAAPAFWIWGMVAGYTDAQNWNRQRGIIS